MLKKTIDKYEYAKQLYTQKNMSLTQIAKKLKINRGRLSEYLKQQGFVITNQQNTSNMNTYVFEKIDTEEKAYWLGFLYADGYVSFDTNHIELSLATCDSAHVFKFGEFLNFDGTIQTNDIRTRISFRSKKIHDDLIKLGCIPQKSLISKFPNYNQVPKHLMIPFIRGYIDGDGYLGMHTNGFGRFSITCGSKSFILGLIKEMGWREKKYPDR